MASSPEQPEVDIRFLHGDPDAEEIAAITAVLTAALDELAGEQRRRQSAAPSAWARRQRPIRQPLVRGAWSTSER
jgi:hypothetical protein